MNAWKTINPQSGRSLVELMIAMAIGLAILVGIGSLFLANRQTSRITDDRSRLEEDGRLALNLLSFHLRMAGYGELNSNDLRKSVVTNLLDDSEKVVEGIVGCAGGFSNPAAVTKVCTNTATNPDGFIVRYVVDPDNANLSGGNPTDCLGSAVITTNRIVENRFYIATNPTTSRRELYCQGNGQTALTATNFTNTAQPIAENVRDMKVTYGFGFDYVKEEDTQTVDRFITATQVDAMLNPPTTKGSKWSKIISVEVCLIVSSANDGIVPTPQVYKDCSGNSVTATDKRLYQQFSTVVAVRSRAAGSLQ
nr:PilW family protein [uncultured Undibacterium sp.]